MKYRDYYFRASNGISIGLLLLVPFLLLVIAWLLLTPKSAHYTCADFGSYDDIPSNWQQVAPWLDGNRNGIPCEELKRETEQRV